MDKLKTFRSQIAEDLDFFSKEYIRYSAKLEKPEYAFNFWILTELFQIEPEVANDFILEYNDGGLDCFVHFEENKELYLIQNKYYSKNTAINRTEVSDFLTNPLAQLMSSNYKRSLELQNIFLNHKDDPDYKVFLLFITTSESKLSSQTKTLFENFNRKTQAELNCGLYSEFVDLELLYKKYYGVVYEKHDNFKFDLRTYQGKGFAAVLEDYNLDLPYETYYIITPIKEIYDLTIQAEKENYRLFDQNIREFLGENPINNAIIRTLKNPDTRKFFLYYNNGITINCDNKIKTEIGIDGSKTRTLSLSNPKVVNGCQTVNSIKVAIEAVPECDREAAFKSAYVLVKVLIIVSNDEENVEFYKNVVKFTNKQNAIPEKSFVLVEKKEFEKIRNGLKSRGILACIKASDKYTYRTYFDYEKNDILVRAKEQSSVFTDVYQKFNDVIIEFEKILQILVAFHASPQIAIQKKSFLLKESSEWFEKYSSQIQIYFTIDNWVTLISLYKKSIQISKSSEKPISPFYVIGFLGYVIRKNTQDSSDNQVIQEQIQHLFRSQESTTRIIEYVEKLCRLYSQNYYREEQCDYNTMIKASIKMDTLDNAYSSLNISTNNEVDLLFRN